MGWFPGHSALLPSRPFANPTDYFGNPNLL